MDILALDFGKILGQHVWPIVQFLIGLGLVVFVHELGHFLAAKAVGIKVLRLALGIGPRLFGFRRGETDYCVNLLPVGGYLRMLGQEDFKPGEGDLDDPRAFESKTVGARLLVISCGVVMNILLAMVLFVIVGLVGKTFPAPVVGRVEPGSPAAVAAVTWEDAAAASQARGAADPSPAGTQPADAALDPRQTVGLLPGDRIRRIEGEGLLLDLMDKDVEQISKVMMLGGLASPDAVFTWTIQREAGGRVLQGRARIGVRAAAGEVQKDFGIDPAFDTLVGRSDGFRSDSPLREGDRVVAVAGRPIDHHWQIEQTPLPTEAGPVAVTVERAGGRVDVPVRPELRFTYRRAVLYLRDGTRRAGHLRAGAGGRLVLEEDGGSAAIEPNDVVGGSTKERLDLLGMVPRLVVAGVVEDGPAGQAGLMPGDVILQYGDVRTPTKEQVHEINNRAAGSKTQIIVLRGGNVEPPMTVVPKAAGGGALIGVTLGSDLAHPAIGGIRAGSPAQKAGLAPGDAIEKVNDRPVASWVDVYAALKDARGQPITIDYRRGDRTGSADLGAPGPDLFDPDDYELAVLGEVPFLPLTTRIVKANPLAAMAWGAGQTWEFVITAYGTLKQLISGSVPAREVAGPLGIGHASVIMARKGLTHLVYFMAVISSIVAVMNFLPFPVLDGGHATLLLVEKVRGRPLPAKVMWGIQAFGLACLLLVALLLTWNDLMRILRGTG